MDHLRSSIIIEKIIGNELLPTGFMAEWSGPPESIPEGWKLADLDLSASLITPTCNGICITGWDVGVPYEGIAYAHPDCGLHGDPNEECFHGYAQQGTTCLICETENE